MFKPKNILFVVSFILSFINVSSQCVPDAEYNFEGDATDGSGNAYHGQVFGATLTDDRNGNPNSANLFDGVDDYMELNNNLPIIVNPNEFTIVE